MSSNENWLKFVNGRFPNDDFKNVDIELLKIIKVLKRERESQYGMFKTYIEFQINEEDFTCNVTSNGIDFYGASFGIRDRKKLEEITNKKFYYELGMVFILYANSDVFPTMDY